jgi:hypothetical protein
MKFTLDVVAANGVPFRVILDPDTVKYNNRGFVSFWDRRFDFSDNGQKVCDYAYVTMMESNRFTGLNLFGGETDWQIDADTFNIIWTWLRSFDF